MAEEQEKSTHTPRKCYRQAVDLMRPCVGIRVATPIGRNTARNMAVMGEFRKPRKRIVIALSVLALATGCSRSVPVPDEGSNQAGQAPFRTTGAANGVLPSEHQDGPQESGLPFDDGQSIPAGTLLAVRLKGALTSAATSGNTLFEAVVDQPVLIDGNTIVPRGTAVIGKVESVRISTSNPERGYVRLALQSVHLGGVDVPVQTASLSARQGPSADLQGSTVRLEDGRRLTFRLMEPIALSPHPSRASR